MLLAAAPAWSLPPVTFIVLLSEGQRREVTTVQGRGDAELVAIDLLLAGLGVSMASDPSGGAVTLTFQRREVSLYNRKSLASVGGDLRLLSSPVIFDQGKWLVPLDSLARLLTPLLGVKVEWRPSARVLLIGNAGVPRLSVSTFLAGDVVRVVFDASEKLPFRVQQQEGRVTVSVSRDVLDVTLPPVQTPNGLVEAIQYLGGRENLIAVTLGKGFQQMKAFEQESPPRLVLELQGPPAIPGKAPPAAAAARAPGPEPAGMKTVVLDPGHGGAEVGAQGPGGTLEKDVTLAIARKLRAVLVNTLGLQVFLTRERDEDVSLEERTAVANNYKADLFVSLHANASRARAANGSEVYFLSYQASDEDSRRVAQSEGVAPSMPTGTSGDLALILWDMAQAEHLEESSFLAARMQEELATATGSEGRGVKQAPFRILVGAAMPAVLVEIAFISNPEEEKLLGSEAFQSKVVAALARGIGRYDQERARRAGFGGGGSHPGGR